jgi:hypothetical protein
MTIHPSQWFHHEAMQDVRMPHPHRLRQLLHDGAFWATVLLIALLCVMFVVAIISGSTLSGEPYTSYYVP